MRTEQETFDLIMGTAKNGERIRAVYMNGFRTDKNIKKDIFQDYDIACVAHQTEPFYEDKNWIDLFGERLFTQCPEGADICMGMEADPNRCFGWPIQFKGGNRLDLYVVPIEEVSIGEGKLCMILLDKDGILLRVPEPSDEDYRTRRPSQDKFWACCNEFWWCLSNIAKGLWREEILYVHKMFYDGSHPQLVKLLNWKVGYETNFQVLTGKASKNLKAYLPREIWDRFLKTCINGNIDDVRRSVLIVCGLFHDIALELERKWGHTCYVEEANASYGSLKYIQSLFKNATIIFDEV